MDKFISYSLEHREAIDRFNERMIGVEGVLNFPSGEAPFREPFHLAGLAVDRLVAIDRDGTMRAGYLLKRQSFRIGEEILEIGNIQAPISEGMREKAYVPYGSMIVMDALKRKNLAYSLGMGGMSYAYPRLLAALRWKLVPVPFFFKIINPFRFTRRIAFLRNHLIGRLLMDALAFTGFASLGVHMANLRSRLSHLGPEDRTERVVCFEPWAEELWAATSGATPFAAVRDSKTLNGLYGEDRFLRFLVRRSGQPLGWVVCLASSFRNHPQFGTLVVGTIVDCLGLPGAEEILLRAVETELREVGVDLIVSNQMHRNWQAAFRKGAFMEGPSNFIFAASPALDAHLEKVAISFSDMHINRGDGDGPIHL